MAERKTRPKNPVTAYAQAVVKGKIPAGKLVRLACERHLRDLKTGKERGLRFDLAAAQHAIDFYGFLRHSKGQWAGQTFVLSPWQQFIVGSIFGWKRSDGTRRFRIAYSEIPRKNGKSTLSAGVGLDLLVADDEPGAEVYSAATKRDQARIVHGEAIRMVKASPALRKRVTVFKDNLSVEATASKYEPLGADADTMDGLNVHGAIVDELHAHKTRDVWDVLDTATGARRQPLIFAITTAGSDQYTVCWEQHEYAVNVLEGHFPDDTFFAYIATIDDGDDWTDPAVWAKANPNYGVSVNPDDLARKCEKAKKSPAAQNAFLRLHLNVWTKQETKWIPLEAWDASAGEVHPEELVGRVCYGGLDLSTAVDVTAFVLDFPLENGAHKTISRFWIPEDTMKARMEKDRVPYDYWVEQGLVTATPGNVIDYNFVEEEIKRLAAQYKIEQIGYDPWNATQLAVNLADDGFNMVEIRQGMASLSAPSKELEKLVLAKKLHHGGNPVLRWMIDCVAIKQDENGNIRPVKPDRLQSSKRIDGVLALIMALSRAIVRQDSTSVYEDRGIVIL